jgi:hypothetical protein
MGTSHEQQDTEQSSFHMTKQKLSTKWEVCTHDMGKSTISALVEMPCLNGQTSSIKWLAVVD